MYIPHIVGRSDMAQTFRYELSMFVYMIVGVIHVVVGMIHVFKM